MSARVDTDETIISPGLLSEGYNYPLCNGGGKKKKLRLRVTLLTSALQ